MIKYYLIEQFDIEERKIYNLKQWFFHIPHFFYTIIHGAFCKFMDIFI